MTPAAAAPGRKGSLGLRVIVADDNRDAATGLAMILQEEGHEALAVYRGDSVLTLAASFRPDVLILDIGMPGLTGFEVAHALRQRLGQACPMLIAVTAWNQPAARELGKATGFSHYLTKPYSTDELLQILASVSPGGPPRP